MKKTTMILFFTVVMNILPLFSQLTTIPKLWLKPYLLGDSATFVTTDGVIVNPSFSFGHINFNIGLIPKDDIPFYRYIGKDMSLNGKITVVSAYFTESRDNIGVWNISRNGADNLWLNSTEVSYKDFGIPYRDFTEQGPIVNISRLNYSDAMSDVATDDTLSIAGDGRYTFNGIFGEFIYFDRDMSYLEEQKWATYLAVTYGVTLRSHYIGSLGDTRWNIDKYRNYSKGIAGLLRSDVFGLVQSKSGIYKDSVVMSIEGDFSDNDYILWGHNGGMILPNVPLRIDTVDYLMSDRQWLVLPSEGRRAKSTSLAYRYPKAISPLGIVLVLDRYGVGGESSYYESEIYRPTRIVDDIMFFDKIVWDTDGGGSDYFSFAVVADSIDTQTKAIIDEAYNGNIIKDSNGQGLSNLWSQQKTTSDFNKSDCSNGTMIVHLTPNPTSGLFKLIVRQAKPSALSITIVDSMGKVLRRYNKNKAIEFTELEDTISETGVYLIHVDNEEERQTLKLVVK